SHAPSRNVNLLKIELRVDAGTNTTDEEVTPAGPKVRVTVVAAVIIGTEGLEKESTSASAILAPEW
ncbi:hypothetical protein Tco_0086044, partial [Tanacetum coccineum]